MKYMILTLSLLLASASGWEDTTSARHTVGLELIARDGALRARVFFSSERLLLEFPNQQRGYLFEPDFYVYLNRSEKTYRFHSYDSLLPSFTNNANDRFSRQVPMSDISVAGFRLTGETAMIAGINATRIVRPSQGDVETEIWVSPGITPPALRAVGQGIRHKLPPNYWDDNNRVPTLFQAILVFGVPLRIVDHQSKSSELEAVTITKENIPESVFAIPSEYRQRK